MTDTLAGTLHVFVAFDWGDEVNLDRVAALSPASALALPRRPRTPSSFSYSPPPLRLALPAAAVGLPQVGRLAAQAGLTIFDFGAVSLAWRISFELSAASLKELAGTLAKPESLVQQARALLVPVHQRLLPAIHDASWQDDLSEEF